MLQIYSWYKKSDNNILTSIAGPYKVRLLIMSLVIERYSALI